MEMEMETGNEVISAAFFTYGGILAKLLRK